MKLGCIIKFIAIIVVILGTSFYLYEKYGSGFIAESKEELKEKAIEKIEKAIDDFNQTKITNPLKDRFDDLLIEFEKKKDQFSDTDFNKIMNNFNEIVKKNKFDKKSIEDLQKLIDSKKSIE